MTQQIKKNRKNYSDCQLWLKTIQEYDDRSMVIAGTSMVELKLYELLKKKMINTGSTFKNLFGSSGQLNQLSTMVGIAYCLNLIKKNTFQDICKIGLIRNEFAHNWKVNNIEHGKITEIEIKFNIDKGGVTKRDQFIRAIMLTAGALDLMIKD